MQEEIFGPILPLLTYDTINDAIATVVDQPKPLALYLFSKNQDIIQQVLTRTSAGGVCVNDTLGQIINRNLPFGGVGNSGMGAYHGKASFDLFSHTKSIQYRSYLDVPLRYPPYENKLNLIRRALKYMG
jgi:aldehyde dehydrogenase (NAD+)